MNTISQDRFRLETLENREVPAAQPGLLGSYFNSIQLTDLASQRVDTQINFSESDWGNGPPGTGIVADDNYSERWTGFVKIDTAGTWNFSTVSNDGVRLWVANQQLIDNWQQHTATTDQGSINLTAGWHPIRLEHFQQNGTVVIQLRFSGPGQSQTIIPSSHLSTEIPDGNPDPQPNTDPVVSGELKAWHRVGVTFTGPQTSETASKNPFLDYRLDVTFTGPSGQSYTVPGFYAADGNAAETSAQSGNQWRVYFTPDQAGDWTYRASFRTGSNVAIADNPFSGTTTSFDGASGSFKVTATDKTGADFRGKGRLEYVDEHYLQFAETKEYFLKGGPGSPENFLAFDDFDQTYKANNPNAAVHQYAPHANDWNPGDPTWQNGEGKNIIGALNYLAEEGMNTLYFLTMTVNGDGKDVWMWTGPNERFRFDVSKLDQWEIVFSHMEKLGIHIHLLTQETENDQLLDGGALGNERKLYYRELVARFGHHLGLTWNLGEENTNSTAERKAFADHIAKLDAYDHPIVVHTFPSQLSQVYTPLLGNENFTGASMQTNDTRNQTKKWVDESAAAGQKWVVALDEIGPANVGVVPDSFDPTHDEVRKTHLWGHLLAGGAGVEWYFGYAYPHDDLDAEDWRSRDVMWDQTRYALEFFQDYLPFHEMSHADTTTANTSDYVFAKAGEVYAIYLPNGGTTTLNLQNQSGTFSVDWFNPRTGGNLLRGSVTSVQGLGTVALGNAPQQANQDWVILVRRTGPQQTPPAAPSNLTTTAIQSNRVDVRWQDNANDETGFVLQRSTSANFSNVQSFNLPANTTSYADTNLATGTTYYYRVQSMRGTVLSAFSNVSSVTTPGTPTDSAQVTRFVLVDADNDADLFELTNNTVIDLSNLTTRNLNIRAEVQGTVESVRFDYNNQTNFRTENEAPYALAGDTKGDYYAWTPTTGRNRLTATPFAQNNAQGTAGISLTIEFTVEL